MIYSFKKGFIKYWRERETSYTDIKQIITRDPWIAPQDTWESCWQSDMMEYGEPRPNTR